MEGSPLDEHRGDPSLAQAWLLELDLAWPELELAWPELAVSLEALEENGIDLATDHVMNC